ncbi:hypothetical protein ES703_17806 [subsurface metagenome]
MPFRIPDWLRYEVREQWERLSARLLLPTRRWINRQNPGIIYGITVASVLLLLTVVIWMLIPEKPLEQVEESDKAWFYDLNTGQLFVGKDDQIPPIEAPSGPLPNGGPAGVKAYVFSYADEPNESERFIGFLETSVPEAIMERLEPIKARARGAEKWGHGRLICRVEDKKWVLANSYQGRFILEEVFLPNETGESARYCPPE